MWRFKAVLSDIQQLQEAVRAAWEAYAAKSLDLAAVAMTVNTAIKVAKSIEDDLVSFVEESKVSSNPENCRIVSDELKLAPAVAKKLLEHDNPYLELFSMLHHDVTRRPVSVTNYLAQWDNDLYDEQYDSLDAVMIPAYTTLSAFHFRYTVKVDMRGKSIKAEEGDFGTYEPEANRQSMSGKEKWLQHRALAMEAITEISVLANGTGGFIAVDELTNGIKELLQAKRVHLWMVFALQTLLIAHRVLGAKAYMPFLDLRTWLKRTHGSITGVRSWLRDTDVRNTAWGPEHTSQLD